jgi:hypothetical protein
MIEKGLKEESQRLIKTQKMPKVNPKKIKCDVFWCVYDKAFTIFKRLLFKFFLLFLHESRILILKKNNMENTKYILTVRSNSV